MMTFAYWSIVLLIFINWLCAFQAKKLAGFSLNRDNHDPRTFLSRLEGKAARWNAAQQNGYEVFAPYVAAVLVAHATGGASQGVINFWALVFIVSRGAFVWFYVNDCPKARSLSWLVGMVCVLSLFIAAI